MRLRIFSLAASVFALSTASASAAAPDAARAWVITQPEQVRDLYLDGELTDTRGNRWQVGIVPGVRSTGRRAGEHWRDAGDGLRRAGDDVGRYGERAFWGDLADTSRDGLRFAFDDSLKELVFEGVPDGLRRTHADLRETVREKPFAWLPVATARALAGYLVEPPLRVVAGSLGAVGGGAWSVAAPTVASTFPTMKAAGRATRSVAVDAALQGTALPVLAIGWHHLAYPLSLASPEPAEHHDGRFGLEILRPTGVETIPHD